MNSLPLIPQLDPKVISLDAYRAWRELQAALLAVKALAEPEPKERPCDSEFSG